MDTNDARSHDRVIRHLLRWAAERDAVRAALLTSTRTMPGATVDPFSDYDVILAVTDVRPFFEDRAWLGDFGAVLAVYPDPIRLRHGCESFAYITQYEADRLKIDFTIVEAGWLRRVAESGTLPDDLDVGYRVLLDKDGLTAGLPAPTHTAHIPTPPSEGAYRELVEVFFHEATYVAKHLWRGDLVAAKYNLDYVMKFLKLRPMIEWQIEIAHDWSLKPGAYGKGLQKYMRPEQWAALERTYVGPETEANWRAMFETIALFREVAIEVGAALGYTYPIELDRRMTIYLRGAQALAQTLPAAGSQAGR